MYTNGRRYRRPINPHSFQSKYLSFDFPMWIKHLPFEDFWQESPVEYNLRQMLAETEELLVKAKAAGVTLEGYAREDAFHFSAAEWCLWLIQGDKEMNLNTLKRNYLELMREKNLPIPGHVQIKNSVLSPDSIVFFTTRIKQLCALT